MTRCWIPRMQLLWCFVCCMVNTLGNLGGKFLRKNRELWSLGSNRMIRWSSSFRKRSQSIWIMTWLYEFILQLSHMWWTFIRPVLWDGKGGDWRSRAAHRAEWPFPPWALCKEPEIGIGVAIFSYFHVWSPSNWHMTWKDVEIAATGDKPESAGLSVDERSLTILLSCFYILPVFERNKYIYTQNIYIYTYSSTIFTDLLCRVLFQTPAANVNHFSAIQTPANVWGADASFARSYTGGSRCVLAVTGKITVKKKPSGTPTLNHHFCQLNHLNGPNLKPTLTLNHLNGPQLLMDFISTVFWSENPMMIFCAPNWDEAW